MYSLFKSAHRTHTAPLSSTSCTFKLGLINSSSIDMQLSKNMTFVEQVKTLQVLF